MGCNIRSDEFRLGVPDAMQVLWDLSSQKVLLQTDLEAVEQVSRVFILPNHILGSRECSNQETGVEGSFIRKPSS